MITLPGFDFSQYEKKMILGLSFYEEYSKKFYPEYFEVLKRIPYGGLAVNSSL